MNLYHFYKSTHEFISFLQINAYIYLSGCCLYIVVKCRVQLYAINLKSSRTPGERRKLENYLINSNSNMLEFIEFRDFKHFLGGIWLIVIDPLIISLNSQLCLLYDAEENDVHTSGRMASNSLNYLL